MKNIIKVSSVGIALGLALSSSFTSCEDMLEQESDLVMYEKDNQLTSVNDTMFSVMGIVYTMQQVADRANLLGEVRGDLTVVTKDASTDLQALANFTADENNKYNNPKDYYAIINNCNYFIAHADSAYKKQGTSVFEQELAAIHSFRAWAYLQLCMNYSVNGTIPFYTDFVGTQLDGEKVMNEGWTDKQIIYNTLIEDLKPWVNAKMPSYGVIDGNRSQKFFIPAQVMLAELCLWAGRYEEAAKAYRDFFNQEREPRYLMTYRDEMGWNTKVQPKNQTRPSLYNDNELIAAIPMQTNSMDGLVSDLYDLYNSTSQNYYFYQLTYSRAAFETSLNQENWYICKEKDTSKGDSVSMAGVEFADSTWYGDLRLYEYVSKSSVKVSGTDAYNSTYQSVSSSKVGHDLVNLYRLSHLYLHYAEALNRAGYPTSAFAVLKYGLCEENFERMDSAYVDFNEFKQAGELIQFDPTYFKNYETETDETKWYGIAGFHARGSGDPTANANYRIPALPTKNDTINYVEDLIMEEGALELYFEGVRYYDLMRVALRRGPEYLAERVSKRNGKDNQDVALYDKLKDTKNWYLPMKK